jgi:Fur family iron response transcriptional regulator
MVPARDAVLSLNRQGEAVVVAPPKVAVNPRELRAMLQGAGMRPTRQRLALGSLLFNNGDRHLTAEQLFDEAKCLSHPPSLATVYNTLHQFAEHGLVREIALYGAKVWYDTKTGPHFHFYQQDSDELYDMPEELIPHVNIVAPEGMQIAAIDVVVRLKPLSKTA